MAGGDPLPRIEITKKYWRHRRYNGATAPGRDYIPAFRRRQRQWAPMRRGVKGPPSGGKMEIFRCRQAFSGKYYLSLDAVIEPIRKYNFVLYLFWFAPANLPLSFDFVFWF